MLSRVSASPDFELGFTVFAPSVEDAVDDVPLPPLAPVLVTFKSVYVEEYFIAPDMAALVLALRHYFCIRRCGDSTLLCKLHCFRFRDITLNKIFN